MNAIAFRHRLRIGVIAAILGPVAASPARAQPGDDARCRVAIRITGPAAMRVSEEEAEQRLFVRCRAGDALMFRTGSGQPIGGLAARHCDMARPIMIERITEPAGPKPAGRPPRAPA